MARKISPREASEWRQRLATKQDLRLHGSKLRGEIKDLHRGLRGEMRELRRELRGEMSEVREFVLENTQRLIEHIDQEGEKTRRHFDVVAENIHLDVAGANKDQISLIKDQKIPRLERRVSVLEERVGVTG